MKGKFLAVFMLVLSPIVLTMPIWTAIMATTNGVSPGGSIMFGLLFTPFLLLWLPCLSATLEPEEKC